MGEGQEKAGRREPHTHYCEAGEHNVEHGAALCIAPLRHGYECPDCRRQIRENEARLRAAGEEGGA